MHLHVKLMRVHPQVKLDAGAFSRRARYPRAMANDPSEPVVGAWARLLAAHRDALGRVERALDEAGLPALSWYDVLLELERAGGDGLRPFELERKLLLAQYNLSRLLERLVKAGCVDREPCEDDGRGRRLSISRRGKAVRRKMWPVYARAIQEAIGSKLAEDEARQLESLLRKLVDREPEAAAPKASSGP